MALVEDFHLMNLDQRLLKAISDLNWRKPTDIQQAVIPLVFERKSIVVQAKTGSGKTAAFVIPILHELLQEKQLRKDQVTTVLVLSPTKELCNQALKNIRNLCKYASRSISFVDVSQYNDIDVLKPFLSENPDILIGTPARIISHLRSGHMSLASVKRIVIDEADLIFTFGHQPEMQEFKNYLPPWSLQVILLSATLDDTTKVLRRCLVKGGEWVRVELPEESFLPSDSQLTQYMISAEEDDKYTILIALLKLKLIRGKTIIFTNSVDRCFKLRLFLEEFGIRSALLNSELPVTSRCHAIDQFNRGLYDYLLATDECPSQEDANAPQPKKRARRHDVEYGVARGIDFQLVSNVINFDFPRAPQLYVHRVGRTARAEQLGTAISFVNQVETALVSQVEAFLNPAGIAASAANLAGGSHSDGSQSTSIPSIFKPFQFRISEVDGFRYRSRDVTRRITRKVIREARLKEIKLELLNSERLKGYFEDHTPDLEALRHDKPLTRIIQPHLKDVPDYLIPATLRALMPSNRSTDRRRRNRWRSKNLELGDQVTTTAVVSNPVKKKAASKAKGNRKQSNPKNEMQAKRNKAKKRKTQNPLFSFGR